MRQGSAGRVSGIALPVAALAVASLCFSPADADDDEIVVTATRQPAPVSQLPARVDILTREDIEARALSTLTEALGAEAVQSAGAGQQASLFLRGANSNHTLALFDGVRLNDASAPNGQYDFGQDGLGALERVETLRGPASALYGSDAIGGVVNVIPRRGGAELYAPFAELALGSQEATRALLGATGGAEGIEYGLTAEWFDSEGADQVPGRMLTHTGDPDSARMAALTASARARSGAYGFDALLRVRDSAAEFDTFSGGAFFDLRADDPDLENEATQTLWRLGADRTLGAASELRFSAGKVMSDRSETDGGASTSAAQATRDFVEATGRYEHGSLRLNTGLSWQRDAIETRSQFSAPLAVAEEQRAAFAVAQVEAAPHLIAIASLRLDHYEAFGTEVTYSGGVVWNRAPFRLFASTGIAFKAATLSQRFETNAFVNANPDLEPERSQSWEIGADWASGGKYSVGVSLYQTTIENLIQYEFSELRNVNIGRAETSGLEAHAEAVAADWATFRLVYAYNDARNDLTGERLARRPAHSWGVAVRLQPFERLTLDLSWSIVGARTDVTYDDEGRFDSANGRVEGHEVGAAAATFTLTEDYQVFARIDNVSDESYEQPAAFAGAPRRLSAGFRAAF